MTENEEKKPAPAPTPAVDPLDETADKNRPSGYTQAEWAAIDVNTRRSILWAHQSADFKKANPDWHKEVK